MPTVLYVARDQRSNLWIVTTLLADQLNTDSSLVIRSNLLVVAQPVFQNQAVL